MKNLLDFTWAGHRLAHVFADGWSTASHKRKMTLLGAPTRTLLFNYKDIKQEIVHTLLLEEYGNHHGQEAGQNCGFNSSTNKWIVGSGSLLCQGLRRRREETAWKRRRIKTSLVVVMLLLRVMTYVVFHKLFWNWTGVVQFVSHEVWRICYLTLSSSMFLTNSVVVITEFLNSNHFQYQWIGIPSKTLTSNASQTRFFCG